MNYWLYITNSDNWQVTKETNLLGASERHRNALSRMEKGDKCLIYVKAERKAGEVITPKIVGEYEIVSLVFENNTRIFHAPINRDETFNLRVRLAPVRVFSTPIEYKPLVPILSFIKNKRHWSGTLQGNAVFKIPEADYRTIISSA